MNNQRIVMYLGGFAKVGGIEAFARDFLLAIATAYPKRELVMWGLRNRENYLLNDIVDSGAAVSRSFWRWGCLWNVPDFVLAPRGLAAVRRASAVIFKRPPPAAILRLLRLAARRDGGSIPLILITPYRPSEYWGSSSVAGEYQYFDVITVQSDEGVRDLEKLGYRGRIENIPLLPPQSCELVELPANGPDKTIRLGFLGRMAAQKNLGYLLDIYQVLTRTVDPAHRYQLHLFGDGAERRELEEKCASLGLSDVVFHGEISRSEVGRAIDTCDMFLVTSFTEGQCLVALEALSRGRPIVATPVGALPEVLSESGLGRLAPLGDASAFAAKIAEMAGLIRENRLSAKTVVNAFRRRFDYCAIVQRYLDLLGQLVTVRTGQP